MDGGGAESGTCVLLVTARSPLVELLTPLAAAVGVDLQVRGDVESAGRLWLGSSLVLVGPDAAARGVPTRRAGVVVATVGPVPDRVWRDAVQIGAEHVVTLPEGQGWLVERLAEQAEPSMGAGRVVGVVGGRGGAGASTLAVALALTAATAATAATRATRRQVLLVDGDPLGGGLDVLLGAEDVGGLRWPDLHQLDGPVRASSLRQLLPDPHGVSLLSWGRGPGDEPGTQAVESVLRAGRRHFDVVVVDLPRPRSPSTFAALAQLDLVLLLVPAEVRATFAAASVLAALQPLVADVRLVVRGRSAGALAPEQVADALGLPLHASFTTEARLPAALERGDVPSPRGSLRRCCRELLAALGPSS